MSEIVQVGETSFDADVLGAEAPILVDFWAPWCGPCRALAPVLEDVARSHGDRVTIAKLNVDDSPSIAARYGVRGIPTMMLFRGGQMASMKVGAMPKGKIVEWLAESGIKA